MHRFVLALFLAVPLLAGEPLSIEDVHFFPESGWNRGDGVMQYNAFVHGSDGAHELAQEWGFGSGARCTPWRAWRLYLVRRSESRGPFRD